jgi:amino acid adenylation domain-containing protein
MVAELQPDRDLSHSPLFRVMFVLQNNSELNLHLSGLSISPLEVDSGTAKFDLFFFVMERSNGLSCVLEYNTDLFNKATIKRMLEQFKSLINGIVTNPDTPISQLPLLTDAEQHMVLVKWNNTDKDYPRQACLHKLFEEQIEMSPEAVALLFEGQQLTYRELNRQANQMAHHLRSLGVEPEVLVGVCMEPSIGMIVGLLGILKAGGAYVPLDPRYPKERLAFMLQDSGVSVLLTQRRLLTALPKHEAKVICPDSDWKFIVGGSDENLDSGATAGNLAYVIYTSGSSGKPKGVLGIHRGAVNRLNWMWAAYPFKTGEICCHKTSISFVDSVWEIFGPMLQGIPIVIISESVLKDPHEFLIRLAENKVSRIVLVPSLLRILLDLPGDLKQRLPCLRHWTSSGEILPVELVRRFREKLPDCTLLNLYGSSEVSADVTFCEVSRLNSFEIGVPIGRPINNTQVYVLNSSHQPAPIGVPGELFIGGDALARGYLNQPDLTAECFIANPINEMPGSRLYKTGDLAKYLSDGDIEVLGRLDFQVKVRGFRIELGDIEATLEQHPSVRHAVVTCREDIPGDKRLVACLVCNDSRKISVNVLHIFLTKKLPAYMVPSRFVFLETLPLTPTGKVDRQALPTPDQSRPEVKTSFLSPRTIFEKKVAGIWSELFGIDKIGIYDNFFKLGGHSLLATRLVNRILNIFQVQLPLKTLWEAPTIAEMAAAILQAKADRLDEQELNEILEKIEAIYEK